MANPTTNFGWVMPTSSSLVTNLPADFNTFGQAVDTSMSELLGGTTGQVLSKTSATNMDFTWVTPTDQTPLTTKGDLFTFTTVDARLAVGTNGLPLVADSAAATGLKWGYTNSISAFLYKAAAQSIPNATWTAVTFSDEAWDTNSFHSTSTNTSRITIPAGLAGKYELNLRGFFAASATGVRYIAVYLNGVSVRTNYYPANAADFEIALSTKINLVASDYVEMYVFQNSGGSLNFTASATEGEFSTTFLGV
jgi:hypothetical protein